MTDEKIKVCVYCRVSTAQDSQSLSFENQKDYYKKYVSSNPNWIFNPDKDIYADKGISGTILNKNRVAFHKMLNKCGVEVIQTDEEFSVKLIKDKTPEYNLIVCKDEKRFARNSNINEVINKLSEKGVGVFFETLGVNTLENKDLYLKILFNVSEEFSRTLSRNMKVSYERAHLKNPMILGHYAPFGYEFGEDENGERTLKPISDEYIKVINEIYDMYIEGKGYRIIALYLKDKGYKTPLGKEIRKDTIQRIIKNEKYAGYIQVIRHTPETIAKYGHIKRDKIKYDLIKSEKITPIVSEDKFFKALSKLESKPISKNNKGINITKSKYSKKIVCKSCGSLYYKTVDSRGASVYVCKTKRENLGTAKECKSPYVSEQFLDDYLNSLLKDDYFIKNETAKIKGHIEFFNLAKYALIETYFNQEIDSEKIASIKKQIKKKQDEQDKFLELFETLPPEVVKRKVESIQAEITILRNQISGKDISFNQLRADLAVIEKAIKELGSFKIGNIKTHTDLLKVLELEITPNTQGEKRQKRNDCKISYRSTYQNIYEEIDYLSQSRLKIDLDEIYLEKKFTEEEKEILDNKLKGVI